MVKKIVLVAIINCIVILFTNAQIRLADVNGKPMSANKYSEVEGSPYLYDDWKKGDVLLNNGNIYNGTEVKFDLVDNLLLFKSAANEILAFSDPVKEFTIFNEADKKDGTHFRNGYGNSKVFYEVLVDGKCQLLKLYRKTVVEKASYGSNATVKMISFTTSYFIYNLNYLIQLKKDKKMIASIFNNRQVEMENYLKSKSINLKEEPDLIKIVTYYNSL